ncbi:hypothetical protein DFH09DRAFT_1455234 [Mycena vulgaris]|nr:hypothetical protein DFH09DRAFT_1455234 [Mycena vulgaris]
MVEDLAGMTMSVALSPSLQGGTPTRPPQTGDRRPRSPDPSLSSGDGDNPLGTITKSPHTARVIKRGRTGPDATPAPDANHTTPTQPAPTPVYTTPVVDKNHPLEVAALAKIIGDGLLEDLKAVLALARGFTQRADEAELLGFCPLPIKQQVTEALSIATELRNIFQPLEHATPAQSTAENDQQRPHTFAEAAKAQPDQATPQALQASKPKRPAPATRRPAAKPRQRTAPSTRLITDLAGRRPTKKPHPDVLCRAINEALDGRLAVSAVSMSRNGNLILHASAPACSAQALAAHRTLIWKTIAPLLGISGRDSVPQEKVTVRVDFIEEEDARRFLHEGIFLFGSHCRATRYRPRTPSGGRPSGGN